MRGRRVILAGVIVAAVLVPAMAEAKDDKPGVGASEHAVSARPRINRLAKAKDCAGLQRELVIARGREVPRRWGASGRWIARRVHRSETTSGRLQRVATGAVVALIGIDATRHRDARSRHMRLELAMGAEGSAVLASAMSPQARRTKMGPSAMIQQQERPPGPSTTSFDDSARASLMQIAPVRLQQPRPAQLGG